MIKNINAFVKKRNLAILFLSIISTVLYWLYTKETILHGMKLAGEFFGAKIVFLILDAMMFLLSYFSAFIILTNKFEKLRAKYLKEKSESGTLRTAYHLCAILLLLIVALLTNVPVLGWLTIPLILIIISSARSIIKFKKIEWDELVINFLVGVIFTFILGILGLILHFLAKLIMAIIATLYLEVTFGV